MGRTAVTLTFALVVGCASIAGLEGEDAPAIDGAPTVPSGDPDAGEAGAAEAPEQPAATFTCGTEECVFGKHACCVEGTAVRCEDVAAGCRAGDAGDAGAPAPPLSCSTYNNCSDDDDCCWDPVTGAECRSRCSSGQARLCRLGVDGCGEDRDCRPLEDGGPLEGVGECVRTGGGW